MIYTFWTIIDTTGRFFLAFVPRKDKTTGRTELMPLWSASHAHRYRFDNPREARRVKTRLGADRVEKVTVQLG